MYAVLPEYVLGAELAVLLVHTCESAIAGGDALALHEHRPFVRAFSATVREEAVCMGCWRRTASVPQLLTYSIRGRTACRAGTGVGSGTTMVRWRARTLTPPVSQRRLTSSVYQTPWHVHGAPTSSVCPLRVCAASSISLDSSTPQASRPSCAHATARRDSLS